MSQISPTTDQAFNYNLLNLLEIINKYFDDFKLDLTLDNLQYKFEELIGNRIKNPYITNDEKLKWCKCFYDLYSFCKKDKQLFTYFSIYFGENTKIGAYIIYDDFFQSNLDKSILQLWWKINYASEYPF